MEMQGKKNDKIRFGDDVKRESRKTKKTELVDDYIVTGFIHPEE